MKFPDGSYGLIKDHPLGKIVVETWIEELTKRGYQKDTHVYSLPKNVFDDIATIIDSKAEPFFKCPSWEVENLLNAWNYQGRHLKKP